MRRAVQDAFRREADILTAQIVAVFNVENDARAAVGQDRLKRIGPRHVKVALRTLRREREADLT